MKTTALFFGDQGFDERCLATVVALGEAIARTVKIAQVLIESGRTVDLAGLDRGVGLLCAKSLDLPPEFGRQVWPRLDALRNDLATLTATLRRLEEDG